MLKQLPQACVYTRNSIVAADTSTLRRPQLIQGDQLLQIFCKSLEGDVHLALAGKRLQSSGKDACACPTETNTVVVHVETAFQLNLLYFVVTEDNLRT